MLPRTPAPHSRRPLWRRVLSAPESGLVVVIAALVLVLTICGGTKNKRVWADVPPGASVIDGPDAITVSSEGRTATYPKSRGWELNDDRTRVLATQKVSRFLEKDNLVLLTTSASYFAVMAVGMTAIIILAGIDLSVGSMYALAAVLGAKALQHLEPGATPFVAVSLALLVCCAAGATLGLINGALVVGLRLHPFIITLGTLAIYRGIALLLTRGLPVGDLPDSLQKGFFKAQYWGVYPVLTIIMILVAIAGTFVLSKTVLGRRIFAIGGNETAARYAGIPVGKVKIIVFTLGGLLAGLAACMYIGYYGTATGDAGEGYELNVIAAAVIGGASLSGGRGSALGAVLGAILVGIIDNALPILDISSSYNRFVMGAAIILAVAFDQARQRLTLRH